MSQLLSINPASGELLASYTENTAAEIREIIESNHRAFLAWRGCGFAERSRLMLQAAQVLRARQEEHAHLMAVEMGKPLAQGRSEVEKCAWACEYYAREAAQFLVPQTVATDASRSLIYFEPLGTVLAVMPWNFPFWQVFRFAAPNLMAGNAALLKHSSNVSGCALAIESVFKEAGFPSNIFRTLLAGSKSISGILEHPLIQAVTLTGSTPAGKAVAAQAGALLKKSVLELGGSDPYVILEDADLDLAVPACVTARLINGGQSCIAAKRFIVVQSVYREFEQRFTQQMAAKIMGDPLLSGIDLGPLARTDLREELHQQVLRSVALGAQLVLGGTLPAGPGAYYPPTVLGQVAKGMPAFDEELFGPVAALIPAADEKEAIRLANDSPFGLGAAVFTRDLARGERIAAHELDAGSCFVNAFVRSDPRLPFGGIKQSGFGRELSVFGIREFVNIKTVYVR